MSASCPLCSAALEPHRIGVVRPVRCEICRACGALWFDAGALNGVGDSVWVDLEEVLEACGGASGLACPRCVDSGAANYRDYRRLVRYGHRSAPELDAWKCGRCGGHCLTSANLRLLRRIALERANAALEAAAASMERERSVRRFAWRALDALSRMFVRFRA